VPELRIDLTATESRLSQADRSRANLFAFPAQSNFSGVKHPLALIDTAHERGWRRALGKEAEVGAFLGLIAKGKALYEGKAFCKVCHGPDGKGLGKDIAPGSLKGPLPRNFTDKKWQAARTDGELFWILKNGSKGTAMAPFIPLILTEEEAWQVLRYVRSFGQP
jgi:cytochrome c553